jgi:uncharacterized protein (TIGR00299 family) protein
MKIAYFDCFSGVAGDMALGALLDAGVPLEELRTGLSSLPVEGWNIETTPMLKSGIHGLKVRITQHGVSDAEELAQHTNGHQHVHDESQNGHAHHDHEHSHDHHHHEHKHSHDNEDHHHEHSHEHHHHEHVHGRTMAEIRDIIEASELPPRVKQASLAVFWRIAEIEAKMHHSTPEAIHFHEIGGLDSMLDIIGVCWCLDYLGVEAVYCSPLPSSTGWVDCAHGRMPIPAPATQELLVGVPMVATEIRGELVTPTGAGLMKVLATSFGPMPTMTPERTGFGAGTKDWPDRPNLVRVVVGELGENAGAATVSATPSQSTLQHDEQLSGLQWSTLQVLECNIDDMNPEFFGIVIDKLLALGALDVWIQPLQMKKNRPAWLLGALCAPEQTAAVLRSILRETTTLGVRVQDVQRASLPREHGAVETSFGPVRVKLAGWAQGHVLRATPEYDDVERLSRELDVPARDIYQAALAAVDALISASREEKQNIS